MFSCVLAGTLRFSIKYILLLFRNLSVICGGNNKIPVKIKPKSVKMKARQLYDHEEKSQV